MGAYRWGLQARGPTSNHPLETSGWGLQARGPTNNHPLETSGWGLTGGGYKQGGLQITTHWKPVGGGLRVGATNKEAYKMSENSEGRAGRLRQVREFGC